MSTTTAFPIGKFEIPDSLTEEEKLHGIQTIEDLPGKLAEIMDQLQEEDLEKTYRTGGWNVRQIIHHLADSHMNAYIRFKLAVTENNPSILGYNQDAWANLYDVKNTDIEFSLSILIGLHERWATLLKSFGDGEWQCTYFHPEWNKKWTMEQALAQYDWHCRHHLEHIKIAMKS